MANYLTENAKEVLYKRYLLKNEDGEVIESYDEFFDRISYNIALADANYVNITSGENEEYRQQVINHTYKEFLNAIKGLNFIPNSPTLMNAGKEDGQLSACFVLPIEDSIDSIFDTLKHTALIHKSGGGTGFSFSRIREANSIVKTTGGIASGPISFMKVFNSATEEIKQGGCFVGDTLIATARGPVPIKDIQEGEMVYSYSDLGYILTPCTKSWKTKENAEVWKLVTDKGLEIYATPDHPFLPRFGDYKDKSSYVKLRDIKPGTPLMPLTRYIKDGEYWISLHDGMDTRLPEHKWIASCLGIYGEHIHHINGNHLDNNPDNLIGMNASEHARLHMNKLLEINAHPFQHITDEQKNKRIEAWKKWFYNLSKEDKKNYKEKVSEGLSKSNKKRVIDGTHNFIADPPMRHSEMVLQANKSRIAKMLWKLMSLGYMNFAEKDLSFIYAKENLPNQIRYTKEKINKTFGSLENAIRYANERNNKVVSVEFSHYEDVYNIEVPVTHNYVVCAQDMKSGVVVSNTRRGANMAMLRVDHPDILDFIDCKTEDGVLNNFNISVAITDEFMTAVKNDSEYSIFSPKNHRFIKTLKAKEVFNKIVHNAWNNGEPGIFFIDRANKYNPIPSLGEFESTNPCGEQILLPNESCNLGSINLGNMIIETDSNGNKIKYTDIWKCTKQWIDNNNGQSISDYVESHICDIIHIDFCKLANTIKTAVHFLDNVIDMNVFPIEEIEKMTKSARKIGLGVMGWAEMLVKLGIPYGSDVSIALAQSIMNIIDSVAKEASCELAMTRGVFPEYDNSIYPKLGIKLRNATLTTIAPTGSISAIASTSSGIEPYFSFAYEKHVLDGGILKERIDVLEAVLKEIGLYNDDMINKIINNHGVVGNLDAVPQYVKDVFVSAHEIAPSKHVKMQAAFQKYVDNAISKTINFNNNASEEDIYNAYMMAYDLGCKGITVYRDGSRSTQVLVTSGSDDKNDDNLNDSIYPVKRNKRMVGATTSLNIGCGNILVTVNNDGNKLSEVVINTSKTGGCTAQSQALGRLISIAMRSNIGIDEIIHQLKGVKCNSCRANNLDGTSCPDAIAKLLESELNYLENTTINTIPVQVQTVDVNNVKLSNTNALNAPKLSESEALAKDICPECGAKLIHVSGCISCSNCTWSKCTG